ncbi:uncharacterized protein PgNI_08520 [Pyricularia grisea]|uniref:BTB domain-containing protein n=1 Tax=Pyricularia grisea TaxID=148305 RepID=A0A6P8AW58_PYRGI|nr:uncharacterized protein PgNI_08520 [Pyricularia grisea]TLD06463.1 hypothetical protein PgNI_08520 [Pyricularia grisea]
MFRFLVGPNKSEFTIHSGLLAHHSAALKALVHGGFQEAQDGCVTWEDVEEGVFLSFWQYAYKVDYDNPGPLRQTVSKHVPTAHQEISSRTDETIDLEVVFAEMHRREQLTKCQLLWEDFTESFPSDIPKETRNNSDGAKRQSWMLVHHAKVYIFADRYGIDGLMDVSLQKLGRNLVDCSSSECSDIVDLTRYCLEELVPERLKRMVVLYVACKVEMLWKSDEFQELVESNGEFAKILIGSMLPRLD